MQNANSNDLIRHMSYSNLAAQFSEQMSIAAIPIIAVIVLHVSAEQSATLQAINTLPFLLLSIPAGILADRYRRKQLMIKTELIRAVALLMLFLLIYSENLRIYELAILSFAIATGTVFYSVATPALVASVVEREHLIAANRKLEISRSVAFTAGPSLGGILAGWASGTFAFIAAFLLSITSIFYLYNLPNEKPREPSGRNLIKEMLDGMHFILHNKYLRPVVATAFFFNTSWYLFLSVFAYYAINELNFSAPYVGIALGFFGAGMIVGALFYPYISDRTVFGRQILLGPACALFSSLLMASTLLTHNNVIVFIAFFFFGFGPIIWTISTTTLRQVITPTGLIARVSSFILTVTFGARPLGAAIGAGLSATLGVRGCMIASAIGFTIQAAIIIFSHPARLTSISSIHSLEEESTN